MGKNRRLTERERKDIVEMFPQLGVTETARRVGCSKSSVQRVWAQEGRPPETTQKTYPTEEPQTKLERLVELRGMLRAAMNDAPPQAMSSLAREYRETMEQIDRMEGGGSGDPVDSALDSIAARIAAKMPAQ
jgi:transposase-like protein